MREINDRKCIEKMRETNHGKNWISLLAEDRYFKGFGIIHHFNCLMVHLIQNDRNKYSIDILLTCADVLCPLALMSEGKTLPIPLILPQQVLVAIRPARFASRQHTRLYNMKILYKCVSCTRTKNLLYRTWFLVKKKVLVLMAVQTHAMTL